MIGKATKRFNSQKKKELYELEQHILKQSIKRFDPLDLLLIISFHLWSEYFTLFINFYPLYLHVYSIMPNKHDQLNMLIISIRPYQMTKTILRKGSSFGMVFQ